MVLVTGLPIRFSTRCKHTGRATLAAEEGSQRRGRRSEHWEGGPRHLPQSGSPEGCHCLRALRTVRGIGRPFLLLALLILNPIVLPEQYWKIFPKASAKDSDGCSFARPCLSCNESPVDCVWSFAARTHLKKMYTAARQRRGGDKEDRMERTRLSPARPTALPGVRVGPGKGKGHSSGGTPSSHFKHCHLLSCR